MIDKTLKLELEQKTYITIHGVSYPLDEYQLKNLFTKVFSGSFDDMTVKQLREGL
jgi:hypothetical protein